MAVISVKTFSSFEDPFLRAVFIAAPLPLFAFAISYAGIVPLLPDISLC